MSWEPPEFWDDDPPPFEPDWSLEDLWPPAERARRSYEPEPPRVREWDGWEKHDYD